MQSLYQAPLKVKPSIIHGFGVFAEADIPANSLIEECHILVLNDKSAVNDYVFTYPNDKNKACLPLGYGAIYNHSNQPNAKYDTNGDQTLMVFIATKPIRKGEEILISYGKTWFDSRQLPLAQMSPRYRMKYYLTTYRSFLRGLGVISAVALAAYVSQLLPFISG